MAELTAQQKEEIDNLKYYSSRAGDFFNALADAYHKVGSVKEVAVLKSAVTWLGRVTVDPVKLGAAYAKDGVAGVASTYLMDKAGQFVGGMATNAAIVSLTGGNGLLAGIVVGTALAAGWDTLGDKSGTSDLLTNAFKRLDSYMRSLPPGKVDPSGATILEPIVVVVRPPIVELMTSKLTLMKELQALSSKVGFSTSYQDLIGMSHQGVGNFVDLVAQKLKGPNALSELGKIESTMGEILAIYEANKAELNKTDPTLAAEMGKMVAVVNSFVHQTNKISPLVIDLDGDGIHSISAMANEAAFDFGDEGTSIVHGWLSKGDAFLALDQNGNGKIDDISELFGGRNTDGYTLLQAHDDNADGVIDVQDAVFDRLLTWQDANSDGVSQPEELRSLRDVGIVSVNLEVEQQNVNDNGNWLPLSSSVVMADGSLRASADIYFASIGLKSAEFNVTVNPNSLVIQGTGRDDVLNGSERNQVYFGGEGSDTFVFAKNSGQDLIVDMTRGVDQIDVSAWDVSSLEEVLVAAYDGGVVIQHFEGTIKVANVTELTTADFIFARQPEDLAA